MLHSFGFSPFSRLKVSRFVSKVLNKVLTHRNKTAPSFDHLVRAAEQRDNQTEGVGDLQISECKALTAASRLSTGINRFTECDDKTYLSAIIP